MRSLSCLPVITLAIVMFLISSVTVYGNQGLAAIEAFSQMYEDEFDLTVSETPTTTDKMALYIVLPGGVGVANYPKMKESFLDPALSTENSVVFSPKISWRKPNIKKLERIITDFIQVAKTTYSIDENKIVLIGYSNGALQGLELLQSNDTLFTSYIAIASNVKVKEYIATPMTIIQWDKDFYFPIQRVSKSVEKAKQLGCTIEVVVAENNEGMNASEYTDELKNLVIKM